MKSLRDIPAKRISKWVYVTLSALGFFYVLYVFKGYGIAEGVSDSGHSLLIRALIYAIVNGAIVGGFEFAIRPRLALNSLYGLLIWHVVEIATGAFAVFVLLNYFWLWQDWQLAIFLEMGTEYALFMLVPISLAYLLEAVIKQSQTTEVVEKLQFVSDNGKEVFEIMPERLLYLKSEGNYVEFYYLRKHELKSHVLRCRLKSIIEDERKDSMLKQCHRSYVVNSRQIKAIVRKKGKMLLDLDHAQIPVSPSFESDFS